jgi:hypothetical protein
MIRKDSEKDSERPHYYSQFWLDVAAGRTVIGGSKSGEELDVVEPEQEPAIEHADENDFSDQHDVSASLPLDGRKESIAPPVTEPIATPEEFIEPEPEEVEAVAEDQNFEHPELQDSEIPDVELDVEEEQEHDEEEEYEEEEDEEEGWGGRSGKKRNKSVRPSKTTKRSRRDTRRSGY